jgi:hypothetical protein
MRVHKSGHEIRSVEDWFQYAPPKMGALHWKDKRSAKELAQSWFRNGIPRPPDELVALLEAKFGSRTTSERHRRREPLSLVHLHGFDASLRHGPTRCPVPLEPAPSGFRVSGSDCRQPKIDEPRPCSRVDPSEGVLGKHCVTLSDSFNL